ncbi:BTB/POZ domain containing protein [Pyrenophora teres f. maculata]|nr:BTB/POZ domain containing protein [Pyrenophora teres f. maculata]
MSTAPKDARIPRSQAAGYVTSPSIRVIVGQAPDQKEFFVHEGLVCPRSEFFRKAMKGPWTEAQERKIDLEQEDPETFALYLELLYTGALPTKEDTELYAPLSKLYVLAEMLMDDTTKTIVLNAIQAQIEDGPEKDHYCFPEPAAIRIIYKGTMESSPAREVMVKFYTDYSCGEELDELADLNEFHYDLVRSLITKRPRPGEHDLVREELGDVKKELRDVRKELSSVKKELAKKTEPRLYHC